MDIQGQMTDQISLIENHIVDHYKVILGVPGIKEASLQSDFWEEHEKVTSLKNNLIIAPFLKRKYDMQFFL